MRQKLILIDGNAIMHRAYHAIPPFKTSKGLLINAVYGFASMLLNLLNQQKPEYIAVCFDMKAKTFRHDEYKDYKATRVKAPDEFYEQIPLIKELVKAFQIPIFEREGFEADDLLGTIAKKAEHESDLITYIVTGDMDTLQLINDKVKVLTPHKGFQESIIYDEQEVIKKYGLNPSQIIDMKGLKGDNSDNIKGVSGIGPKNAEQLLQKYGTIENIYEHLDELKGTVKEKLAKGKEDAFLSKHLATLITDIPIDFDLDACKTHEYNQDSLRKFFEKLEFKSLLKKLENFNNHSTIKKEEDHPVQRSLF